MMEEVKRTVVGVNLTIEAFHRHKQGNFNAGDEKVLEFRLEKCNKMFVQFKPLESHILLLCACLHMVLHVHHIIECNCCYYGLCYYVNLKNFLCICLRRFSLCSMYFSYINAKFRPITTFH